MAIRLTNIAPVPENEADRVLRGFFAVYPPADELQVPAAQTVSRTLVCQRCERPFQFTQSAHGRKSFMRYCGECVRC